MTDTQPAAQVDAALKAFRNQVAYDPSGCSLVSDDDIALVCNALEAAQREIAELRAERDALWSSINDTRKRLERIYAQGSDVTADAEGGLHLANCNGDD